MKNISFLRYPGGKANLLPTLLTYLEPMIIDSENFADAFVGGGSVALTVAQKYADKKLHINDLDDWIYSCWKIIVEDPSELIKLLDVVPTIEMFNDISNTTPTSMLDKAFRAIFFNRCCFSGIVKRNGDKVKSSPIGGKEQKSKYKVNCRYNFKKLKEKILICHDVLKNRTTVSNLDIEEFLNVDLHNCVYYLDPPYLLKGSQLYNSFMTDVQHKDMAAQLQLKDNWVVSIDDDPRIRNFYSSNKVFDLSARYSIQGKKDSWDKKNELIILK